MKQIVNTAIAVLGLPVALPAVLICAAAIKLTSTGPVIFRQTRVGLHEKPFTCYKLRTMFVSTADAPSHETSASAVTPVGKWLRGLKLDELPQLWNILRGEMSFVGPRPCLPSQKELITARRERGLYDILPGITGIAQVDGIDMSDAQKLAKRDADYLADMSLAADFRLILATVLGAGRGDRVKT